MVTQHCGMYTVTLAIMWWKQSRIDHLWWNLLHVVSPCTLRLAIFKQCIYIASIHVAKYKYCGLTLCKLMLATHSYIHFALYNHCCLFCWMYSYQHSCIGYFMLSQQILWLWIHGDHASPQLSIKELLYQKQLVIYVYIVSFEYFDPWVHVVIDALLFPHSTLTPCMQTVFYYSMSNVANTHPQVHGSGRFCWWVPGPCIWPWVGLCTVAMYNNKCISWTQMNQIPTNIVISHCTEIAFFKLLEGLH